jgi:hypothetical protein
MRTSTLAQTLAVSDWTSFVLRSAAAVVALLAVLSLAGILG